MENYDDDGAAIKVLESMGYWVCFSIGPDAYLTNDSALNDNATYIECFETAARAMIASNKDRRGWYVARKKRTLRQKIRDKLLSRTGKNR